MVATPLPPKELNILGIGEKHLQLTKASAAQFMKREGQSVRPDEPIQHLQLLSNLSQAYRS